MSLRDILAGAQTAERPDAQTPKPPAVSTPERLSVETPAAVVSVQASSRPSAQQPRRSDAQAPRRLSVATAKRPELPLQGTAKSKHPDFEKKTIYVRSNTAKRAGRKWEDEDGGDFSELVEKLLQQYAREDQ